MKLRENTEEMIDNLLIYFTEIGTELSIDKGILEITRIIFRDRHPKIKLAYLFAETKDNQVSSFQAAGQMKQLGLADKFLICDRPEVEPEGYPGAATWQKQLGQKVDSENVFSVQFPFEKLNTLTESMALVSYLRRVNTYALYIVCPHFHQSRAFMTLASVALRNFSALKIYNYPGILLPWEREVYHSQGILNPRKTRKKLIEEELIRIMKYQAKGDILPSAQILDYINRRK